MNATKLFFNEKDIEQLSIHPVSNSSIIISKLLFLFVTHYVTCFIFVYPLFIAYGSLYTMTIRFYYLGLFYPVLSFFFEMGVALFFVYPLWIGKKWLKKLRNKSQFFLIFMRFPRRFLRYKARYIAGKRR